MPPKSLSHQPQVPSPGNDHDEVKLGQEIELDPSRLLSDEEMEDDKDNLSGKRGDIEMNLMPGQSLSHEAPMEITLKDDQEQHVDEMELVEVDPEQGEDESKNEDEDENKDEDEYDDDYDEDDDDEDDDEDEDYDEDDDEGDDEDEDYDEDEDDDEDGDEDEEDDDDGDENEYEEDDDEDMDENEDDDGDEDEDDDDDGEEDENEDEDEDEDDDDDGDEDEDDGAHDEHEDDDTNKKKKRTVTLRLSELKELRCPICLGIMRKTKAVMECMHRFCGKCIEKAMRLSKRECPVCRVHIPSRRSLRDDLNIDNIIAIIFPDIGKYEKEDDLALDAGEITDDKEESASMDDGTEDENIVHVSSEIRASPYDHSITQVGGENGSSSRLSRFIDHLRNSDVNEDQIGIPLALVSLDEQKIPTLQEPYLYCRPTCSVKILCKYVALKAELLADQVELSLVEESQTNVMRGELTVDPDKDKLHVLRDDETLADLYKRNFTNCKHLLLAYKMK